MKHIRKTALFAVLCVLMTGCGPTYTGGPVLELPDQSSGTQTGETPAAGTGDEAYVWYLEPCIEAEDINVVAEEALDFNYGWFLDTDCPVIQKDGKLGVIDYSGYMLVEPKYASVGGELDTEHAHYGFFSPEDKKQWYFCDKTHEACSPEYRECTLCGEHFSTTASGYGYFYDPDRKVTGIYEPGCVHMEESDYELALFGQYIFEAKTTEDAVIARRISLPDDYADPGEETRGTVGEGFAVVKGDQMLTDFVFDEATDFKDGVAAVCKAGKWGYVDQAGKTVISFEFDADLVFSNQVDTVEWSREAKYYPYLPSGG